MEFKNQYSKQEIEEAETWFRERWDKLPQSLQADPATRILDLRRTLENLIHLAKELQNNPTYAGQIYLLFKIKDKLQEDGID
ncbi:MAG: DUF6965 family protein [Alloprevotella sp.]